MGCKWATVDGKRVRVGPVDKPRKAVPILRRAVIWIMAKLGLEFVSASPKLTIDDLRDAIMRLWLDPETGYLMEARMSPAAEPVYHSISQQEATLWEAGMPTPEFIARMFTKDEPVDN